MNTPRLLAAGLTLLAAAAAVTAAPDAAHAQQRRNLRVAGPGLSGSLTVTYGPATDARYASAFQVTGVSGTFTNTNNGLSIVNAPVLGLVPVNFATPEPTNLLAPNNFSRYLYEGGSLSYTNLFWPGGSPQTASDYPFSGGVLDIYGLLLDIGDGRVVNLWSDGNLDFGPVTYGAAVATANGPLDYVFAGVRVSVTPEPGSLALLGAGGVGLVALVGRRRRAARAAVAA